MRPHRVYAFNFMKRWLFFSVAAEGGLAVWVRKLTRCQATRERGAQTGKWDDAHNERFAIEMRQICFEIAKEASPVYVLGGIEVSGDAYLNAKLPAKFAASTAHVLRQGSCGCLALFRTR